MDRRDFHSRLVGWLKVALPLAALAILSTLFLLSDRIDPERRPSLCRGRCRGPGPRTPDDRARPMPARPRTAPALTLSASEARPAGRRQRPAVAAGLRLELATPDGGRIGPACRRGGDGPDAARQLRLSGGVTLTTASGYRLETAEVEAELDRTHGKPHAGSRGDRPGGGNPGRRHELTSGQPHPGAYLLVFKGNVRLVYQPGG
jgi:lipopolysaccharide export system protein LptC